MTLVDVACGQALHTYSKGNEPRENARGSGEATMAIKHPRSSHSRLLLRAALA